MTPLEIKLKKIKKTKKIGLMTHLVVGYPTLEKTAELAKLMAQKGADIIELQIPFSDPLADGPTIMRACKKSLDNGTKVKDAFKLMHSLSSQIDIPFLFMTYFNIVFRYSVEKFCQDAKAVGASGLIVPDMPIDQETQEHFFYFCRKYRLHNIQVVSPVSTDVRLEKNAQIASGFIYCAARQGVTGAKSKLDPKLGLYLEKVKQFFTIPVASGFGIAKRKHIGKLASYADIAVVGSAIIDVVSRSNSKNFKANVESFLDDLKM